MSLLDSRGRFPVSAIGFLGGALGACATEDLARNSVEPSEGIVHPSNMSGGWELQGELFGGGASDEANDVMVGPDKKVYVAGYMNGVRGLSSVDPGGNAIGVIFRYDPNTLHQEDLISLGGSNSTAEVIEALAVEPAASGFGFDLYFAGRTNGAFAGTHFGQFDTLVGWIEPNGNVAKFQYGTVKPQHPRHLVVDSARDLFISGHDDIYIPSNFVDSWEDPFVLKVQRTGDSLGQPPMGWPFQANTTNSDLLPGMAKALKQDAPVYVAGTSLTGSGRGMFVKKILPNGTVAWHARQSQVGLDFAAALAVLPDDNILFAGATFMQLGDTSHGGQDVVVRVLTPEGQVVWTKQHGTSDSDFVTDMTVDHEGNIYIVGETLGSFDPLVEHQGEVDIFVLKLAPDGSLVRAFQLGSSGDDHPTSVAVDRSGHVFVAGYTTGDLFGEGNHDGDRDGFVFRVTPPEIRTQCNE